MQLKCLRHINTSKTITSCYILIHFQVLHLYHLTNRKKNILKISQGTKISTTKIDRTNTKIKPVLNLICIRYVFAVGSSLCSDSSDLNLNTHMTRILHKYEKCYCVWNECYCMWDECFCMWN